MDNLYTKKRSSQFRGPTTSDDYNARIEENYKDLMHLVNRLGVAQEDINKKNRALVKQLTSITVGSRVLSEVVVNLLSEGIGTKRIIFAGRNNVEDTDRFNGTAFQVGELDRCTMTNNFLTLPIVESASASKLKFEDENSIEYLPSTFEAYASGVNDSIDNASAFVNTTDVANAIIGGMETVWERMVVTDYVSTGVSEAQVDLFVRVPEDLSSVSESNFLTLSGFPLSDVHIIDIGVTENPNPMLRESDGYTSLNPDGLYLDDDAATNFYLPPSLEDSVMLGAYGVLQFYFDPRPITAFKITLSQKSYIREGSNYVFTYGLTKLDLRYNKYLDTGKIIYKVDAPEGDTISQEYDITPHIYNVSLADIPYVFSYRTIWETSLDSGVYTTDPVPFSDRCWVEVTLNKTPGGGTPSLSTLDLN